MSEKEHGFSKNSVVVFVLAGLLLGTALGFVLRGSGGTSVVASPTPSPVADANAAGLKAVSYLNKYLLAGQGMEANLTGAKVENGAIVIGFDVFQGGTKGNSFQAFVTLDGDKLILSSAVFDLNKPLPTPTPLPTPPKQAKVEAELFVMSFCPYGVQAENAISPAARLLGKDAEVNVRFIVSDCAEGLCSLHGPDELNEDKRQVCILKYEKSRFWNYVDYVNANCSLDNIGACWLNASKAAGVNSTLVQKCFDNESVALLKADQQVADVEGVSSSPTFFVNGVLSQPERTPEGFKKALCDAFSKAPADCGTALNASGTAASGSC